jgi:hypothetical protein
VRHRQVDTAQRANLAERLGQALYEDRWLLDPVDL